MSEVGRPSGDVTVDAHVRESGRSLGRALLLGSLVAAAVAVLLASLSAVLDVKVGTLAIAAVGGWLIGATAPGRLIASLLAFGCWLGSLALDWLISLAILPGSSRTLPERIGATPFLDWLGPQFGLLEIATLVLLVGVAIASTRAR